jgi:hypothetical protein
LFGEYLAQTSWYRAENFIVASTLQSQHIPKISANSAQYKKFGTQTVKVEIERAISCHIKTGNKRNF